MERERAAVLSQTGDLTTYPDDLLDACGAIAGQIPVVLVVIGPRHEHVHVPTDDFMGGISEQSFGRAVEGLHVTASIDDHDAIHGGFDDRAPTRFAAPQRLLDAFLLRDVPRDRRGAQNLTGRILDGRYRERDLKLSAILRQSSRLEVRDTLVGSNAREDLVEFMTQFTWNQERNWLSDRFACGIPVHPLGAPIPTQDDALEVLGDDRVFRRIDNGGENAPVVFWIER